MFVYALADRLGSNVPIVRSFTRRQQEQDQLNRQHVLQQALELELSKQHIASAVTILSDAFLAGANKSHARSASSSGTITPTPATVTAEPSERRSLRSVRSNPLMRLLPSSSSPPSPPAPTPVQQKRSSNELLVPTQSYAFAPVLPSDTNGSNASVGMANATLADQYIQSVHFLLSALSPTQAAQLPELSRRQMRMSLAQAIDRLDLAADTLGSEQERSSFWSARSQVSALDRLLRGGDFASTSAAMSTQRSSTRPMSMSRHNSYQGQSGRLSPVLGPHDSLGQSGKQPQSSSSKRTRALELATLPAHAAYGAASQALSAMVLCTQLALSVALPMIWLMLRLAPVKVLRADRKASTAHQIEDSNAPNGGLLGLHSTARSAATQVVEFANSPLGLYANAMIAKHAPNVHAGASAVWNFAAANAATLNPSSDPTWSGGHLDTCPARRAQSGHATNSAWTATSASNHASSAGPSPQQTLVGSPWPPMASDDGTSCKQRDAEIGADGKYLTWPRQPDSPRSYAISAPDQGPLAAGNVVPFPAHGGDDQKGQSWSRSRADSDAHEAQDPPVNKRHWSSLIGRGSFSSAPASRPPLPEGMSVKRQHSGSTQQPPRALSISHTHVAPAPATQNKPKHTRQHSWAPQASSSMVVYNSAPTQQSREVAFPAHANQDPQATGPPTLPDVLNSISVRTSRVLSDPQSSYSVYNLVPGAGLRRAVRKNVSRSMRQAIFWARTNGVLRAGVDAVCVGLEAALAGVEAWGDAEYERQEEGQGELYPGQLETSARPCPCGQMHYAPTQPVQDARRGPQSRGLGISLA